MKYVLTKANIYGIINISHERVRESWKKTSRKFQKSLKNLLTKANECDIIYKLSTRCTTECFKSSADDPWKLNNRRKIVRIILEIRNYLWNLDNSFLQNRISIHSKQVRELNHSSDIDYQCKRKLVFIIPTFESLILAQDERWRRA